MLAIARTLRTNGLVKQLVRPFVGHSRGYHESVVDHFENPRNVGSLDKDDEDVGTALVGAPACGDVMRLQVKIEDGVVVDSKVCRSLSF